MDISALVALRKESVDRNTMRRDFKALHLPSLSARRAWIEIYFLNSSKLQRSIVALRKESVDRNPVVFYLENVKICRSPQGERG